MSRAGSWKCLCFLGVCAAVAVAGAAAAATVQRGDLRISISARLSPHRLPRVGTAPVTAYIAGHVASVDGRVPSQLQQLDVLVNRHGRLDFDAVPTCPLARIRTATNESALASCARALVGSGRFWASVLFNGNRPYHTFGRLLIFNARRGAGRVLAAHIYTSQPFPSSFNVIFAARHISRGPYGTELSASLPQTLGSWGVVNRIKLNLKRVGRRHGREGSFLRAGCPALRGARTAAYSLARATFTFAGERDISLVVPQSCGVRE